MRVTSLIIVSVIITVVKANEGEQNAVDVPLPASPTSPEPPAKPLPLSVPSSPAPQTAGPSSASPAKPSPKPKQSSRRTSRRTGTTGGSAASDSNPRRSSRRTPRRSSRSSNVKRLSATFQDIINRSDEEKARLKKVNDQSPKGIAPGDRPAPLTNNGTFADREKIPTSAVKLEQREQQARREGKLRTTSRRSTLVGTLKKTEKAAVTEPGFLQQMRQDERDKHIRRAERESERKRREKILNDRDILSKPDVKSGDVKTLVERFSQPVGDAILGKQKKVQPSPPINE